MLNVKNLPLIISLLALIIVLAFARYADQKMKSYQRVGNMREDGSIAPADLDELCRAPACASSPTARR
ncbi:MAG TPA: hypothetical protein PLF59_17125 [Cyclobacteriaceae bacterium]|nr:hypothetical protein [Cyclobacteriaceae bacterium]